MNQAIAMSKLTRKQAADRTRWRRQLAIAESLGFNDGIYDYVQIGRMRYPVLLKQPRRRSSERA